MVVAIRLWLWRVLLALTGSFLSPLVTCPGKEGIGRLVQIPVQYRLMACFYTVFIDADKTTAGERND
ncbi:MAG: hypothetical protein B0W54_11225 [Cellvibrio sp. 79]|nr:MAG: hypothetical protein B0W54_11225 [Cellvibrio sp. 79]